MCIRAVIDQINADDRLAKELKESWRRIVILERLARGGGATNWFVAEDYASLRLVVAQLSPGSSVSFYFVDQIHVDQLAAAIRLEIAGLSGVAREVLVGTRSARAWEVNMEIVSGPLELSELLEALPDGTEIFWGRFPGREDDGVDAVSVLLVDADDVLRSHPH